MVEIESGRAARVSPVQVIAHRGASRAEPENTVAAFLAARSLGADGVELDVRRTRDGALVVHHDARLPDGRVIVGTDHRDLPASVPTFAEALDACAGMWVNIEIKNMPDDEDFDPDDTVAHGVTAELVRRDEHDRWLISSFNLRTIDVCHTLLPPVRTALLCMDLPRDPAHLLGPRGHSALHPWWPTVTAGLVVACHDAGLEVNTWTVDGPGEMEGLLAHAVDGLCTNVPDVARSVLEGLPGTP